MLNQFGDVYPVKNPDGTLKMLRRSPYSAMQMELSLNVRRMLAEFGLTPSSRGRMIALPGEPNVKKTFFTRQKSIG
jgi:phage terminase small subunit